VNRLDVGLSVYLMNRTAAALQEFELRQDVRFRPCKTSADRLFRVVVPAAGHEALHRGIVVDDEIDDLKIITLEEVHRIVERARLVRTTRETIGNNVFLPREIVDKLFGLQIRRHEIRHADSLVDHLSGEFTSVRTAITHIAQLLTHVDMNDIVIGLCLEKVDEHLHLRALTRTLGTEEEYRDRIHMIIREYSLLYS